MHPVLGLGASSPLLNKGVEVVEEPTEASAPSAAPTRRRRGLVRTLGMGAYPRDPRRHSRSSVPFFLRVLKKVVCMGDLRKRGEMRGNETVRFLADEKPR